MDEGSDKELTLPRRVFVMLKNCLDVLLASVTVEQYFRSVLGGEFPGLNVHRRAGEGGDTELRQGPNHPAVQTDGRLGDRRGHTESRAERRQCRLGGRKGERRESCSPAVQDQHNSYHRHWGSARIQYHRKCQHRCPE